VCQETIGSAIAIQILTNGAVPLAVGCIMVSASAFALLLLDRLGFRQLEGLFALFISVEAVALGINFCQAGIPLGEVAKGVVVPQVREQLASSPCGERLLVGRGLQRHAGQRFLIDMAVAWCCNSCRQLVVLIS
jgi:hypothetical protein